MARILLVRHAQVTNPEDLLYGMRDGFPLSDRGKRQAEALGTDIRAIAPDAKAIVVSPAVRTRETAAAIAEALGGAEVREDERLGEWKYGAWEGKTIGEFYRSSGYLEDPESVVAEETFGEMSARVRGALEDLAREVGDGVGIAISHREPLVSAILSYLGKTPKETHGIDMPVASAWEIVYTDGAVSAGPRKVLDRHDVK